MAMTVQEIIQIIHRRYEGDTNYPTSGEDFNLMLGLINDAILEWGNFEGVRWKELIEKKTGTTTGTNQITCPSDFQNIISPLKIDGAVFEYKKPKDASQLLLKGSGNNFFFISYTNGNYRLNINPTPATDLSYEYYYYKKPPSVSQSDDEVIVPNPLFVVNYVLAKLYELDNQLTQSTARERDAMNILGEMVAKNEGTGGLASNSYLDDDIDYQLYGITFGE